jgi:phosphoserine phosphatase
VAKLIDRGRLKEINHALLLGRHNTAEELALVAGTFADETMRSNVLPGALAQIAADRAAGRRLVMATASYRLYASVIAERLGFDDVIATNSVAGLDGRIRAKIDGENSYGPAKLRMIEAWMITVGLRRTACRIWFYSDHASDAPVFEWCDVAVAANPSKKLRAMAAARGWPVVEWETA